MRQALGQRPSYFQLKGFQVTCQRQANGDGHTTQSLATIKVAVEEQDILAAAEGNGPVAALDAALRKALLNFYPGHGQLLPGRLQGQNHRQWGWHRPQKPEF